MSKTKYISNRGEQCIFNTVSSNIYVYIFLIVYKYIYILSINIVHVFIFSEGSLYTAGINNYAQLGHHGFYNQKIFSKVEGLPRVKQIAVGGGLHCVVLTHNGQVCYNSPPHSTSIGAKCSFLLTSLERHLTRVFINTFIVDKVQTVKHC